MKSNVPWSVKGIDPEARVVAKEAARKAGMTLGEWMNSMIREAGTEDQEATSDTDGSLSAKDTGVSPDQLRAVVDSLNRLNERLKATEESVQKNEQKSREALGGVNHGLESMFDRIKRIEAARPSGEAASGTGTAAPSLGKERLQSLKALEGALTQMIEQFDATRKEALSRVEKNEEAVAELTERVDVLDTRITAQFQEVNDALDAVGVTLDQTEQRAKLVMEEAKRAAKSTDPVFVEKTGKQLQALGNEIKRSGDQIVAVEEMVTALTAKIEAAEKRSADGIEGVADDLKGLRHEIMPVLDNTVASGVDPALKQAAESAEETVASLQKAYDDMIMRLERKPDPVPPPVEQPSEPIASEPEKPKAPPTAAPAAALQAAAPTVTEEPTAPAAAAAPAPSPEEEFDAVFGTGEDSQPEEKAEEPAAEAIEPAVAETDTTTDEPAEPSKLTAREKIIAAARARKARAEKEKEDVSEDAASLKKNNSDTDDDQKEQIGDPALSPAPPPLTDDVAGPDRPATSIVDDEGQNKFLSVPLLVLIGIFVLTILVAVWIFTRGGSAPDDQVEGPVSAEQLSLPSPTPQPVEPVQTTPDPAAIYRDGLALKTNPETDSDRVSAFSLIQESALYGYAPAQYELGEMYYTGFGTPQNFDNARDWYSRAAAAGNVPAMHRLGTLEADESFNGADYVAALDYFGRAANYGFIDSMYNLGFLYDPNTTDHLPQAMLDAEQSYRWYRLAEKMGDPQAGVEAGTVASWLSEAQLLAIDNEVAIWQPLPINPDSNDGLPGIN